MRSRPRHSEGLQMDQFRRGLSILVVAARGIDIPVLENVINYDFPPSAKVFGYRIGRTGRQGWSFHSHKTTVSIYWICNSSWGWPIKSDQNYTEPVLRGVMRRDLAMYERSKGKSSSARSELRRCPKTTSGC